MSMMKRNMISFIEFGDDCDDLIQDSSRTNSIDLVKKLEKDYIFFYFFEFDSIFFLI